MRRCELRGGGGGGRYTLHCSRRDTFERIRRSFTAAARKGGGGLDFKKAFRKFDEDGSGCALRAIAVCVCGGGGDACVALRKISLSEFKRALGPILRQVPDEVRARERCSTVAVTVVSRPGRARAVGQL